MAGSLSPTNAAPFSLRLFGPFAASIADHPMAHLRSRKGQWILALLALRAGNAVERDWLAGTLWPDNEDEKALYSLRRSLADLRQALESEAWRIEAPSPRTLCLNLEGAEADVRIFDQAVTLSDPAAWQQAVAVYTGPLLEGCSEEWVFQERIWREEAYLQMLERLAAEALRSGRPAQAVEWLRQVISLSPFRETAQRALLKALAAQQDFAGVLLAYRNLRLHLRRELNAAPDPETTALLQQIRKAARQRGEQVMRTQGAPLALQETPEERDGSGLDTEETDSESALSVAISNLPHPRTRFVGHQQLIADLCQSLVRNRLVTLTGTGGVGKTRLAIQAAKETASLYAGRTWLVDLAPLHNPEHVLGAVAQGIALSPSHEDALQQAITDFLNGATNDDRAAALLIMDNCEHLLEACARVVDKLLHACPRLHILATSRQALALPGEIVCRIPSLPAPPLSESALTMAEVREWPDRYPALRLFLERAQSSNPAFALTMENAQDIALICHRLDGIPLAIELAAARVRAMPLKALATRLQDRFQLLVSEDRTGLPRHRTLRALVTWSYDLLSPHEQRVLCRLAVFRNGWTLQAAEAVCGEDTQLGLATGDVLDLLMSLVDKSLVFYDPTADEERYYLQEAIRQFAWQLLVEANGCESVQERHFRCYLALAHEADARLAGSDQRYWLTVLERERYNLEAALGWAANTPSRQAGGMELAGLLARFWLIHGYWKEGRAWLERFLSLPIAEAQADVWTLWARAYNGLGALAWAQGDHTTARVRYEQSLQAWRKAGDVRGQAVVLGNLGILAFHEGNLLEARRLEEQSLGLRRQIEDKEGIANSLSNLGMIAWEERDYDRALVCYAESLALRRERNDLHGIATCLNNLGLLACDQENYMQADALFVESEAMFRTLEDRNALAETLHCRADVAYRQHEDTIARSLAEESIALFRQLGERHRLCSALLLLARLAQRQTDERGMLSAYQKAATLLLEMGDHQRVGEILEQMAEGFIHGLRAELAVRLIAAVIAWRSEWMEVMDAEMIQRWRAKCVTQLGEQAFMAAWMQGNRLTPEQALALTQQECMYSERVSASE